MGRTACACVRNSSTLGVLAVLASVLLPGLLEQVVEFLGLGALLLECTFELVFARFRAVPHSFLCGDPSILGRGAALGLGFRRLGSAQDLAREDVHGQACGAAGAGDVDL